MSLTIKWLGHAGFRTEFTDHAGAQRVVYFDPWIPNPCLPEDFKEVPADADLVLVSHGHFDHAATAPDIILASIPNKPKTSVVANFEITSHYQKYRGVPEENNTKMNTGGTVDFEFC